MKHRFLLALLACSAMLLGSTPVVAGTIVVSGGTAGSIPGGASNDLLNGNVNNLYGTPNRQGFYGAQLLFGSNGTSIFDVEYLGKEAGFINTFSLNGSQIFSTASAAIGDIAGSFSLNAITNELIPFLFSYNTTNKGGSGGNVVNGTNPDDSVGKVGPNFFVACLDVPTSRNCNTIDIFLDDGGANRDDDHDDIAIRLTARAAAVPEPMTLVLLGLGLIAISLTRKQMKA